jgi:polyphosphate kinase
MDKEGSPYRRVVIARIAADMFHHHFGIVHRESVNERIELTYLLPVAIAVHRPERFKFRQPFRHAQRTDITGMPYLVALLEILLIAVVPPAVSIRQQSYSLHILPIILFLFLNFREAKIQKKYVLNLLSNLYSYFCTDNLKNKTPEEHTMEEDYQYFKRDISWLSFNYRVLLEAEDSTLSLRERINFIAIYSSNLEEFYRVRVADHRAAASGVLRNDEYSVQSSRELVDEINETVNEQLSTRTHLYRDLIIPALEANHVVFYQSPDIRPEHEEFVRTFFRDEVFPFLQPVPVGEGVKSFLRANRLYLAVRLLRNGTYYYFVIKQPFFKVPRFIELPNIGDDHYIMFLDDVIKANLSQIFPGYEIDSVYSIKISRDADIMIDENGSKDAMVADIKSKVKKRKIGDVCRFVYDRSMPADFLQFLTTAYHIDSSELVLGEPHLNLEDLSKLPLPKEMKNAKSLPAPMRLQCLNGQQSIFDYVAQRDLLIYFPYFSYDHFLHFLSEAARDPYTEEIMLTQYRVAAHSAVIDRLIEAVDNGKKVTVFVELKARFDEENNLETSEEMKAAGIHIIYSMTKLKVHAKVALVKRRSRDVLGRPLCNYAYIGTGNFNEDTATVYADIGLFTSDAQTVDELHRLFLFLSGKERPTFQRLLVTQFNLVPELLDMIQYEIDLADAGKGGRMIIKMNALQDQSMIDRLYEASQHGVRIDLIVRGICCLMTGQPYSKNITVTRIIDSFLEHARVWYFHHGGKPKLFIGSPDWMRRNLYRRIEVVTPILDETLKTELTDMLHIQLTDNEKACWLDAEQRNQFKHNFYAVPVRAQRAFYHYLKEKNEKGYFPNLDEMVHF